MRQLTVVATALWLGTMGFFAFVVAPAAFTTLERGAAGKFVGAVFPRYYALGLAFGVAAMAGLGARWIGGAWRGWDWLPAGLAFARLHRLSGILNAIVMLSGVVVLVLEMARRR